MATTFHRDGHSSTPTGSRAPLDLSAGAEFYRHLGWPASLDSAGHRLVVHTGDVLDALIVPARLAEPVAAELSTSLMSGPVSTDADDRWWTFLTEPCRRTSLELPADLRAAKVRAVPRGAYVVVPHPADSRHWTNRPEQGHVLPPWSAVVAIARKVLDQRH